MSAQHTPQLRRLFDLPLGSHFRYISQKTDRAYVLLSYADSGLVSDAPNNEGVRPSQRLYSADESRKAFEALMVEFVPVVEAAQRDELLEALQDLLQVTAHLDPCQATIAKARAAIARVEGAQT